MKYFAFVAIIMTFLSCKKDCPDTKEHLFKLSADEKAYIPYTGKDTLTFLDQDGYKVIYYGQGRKNDFKKYSDEGEECPSANIYYVEQDITIFTQNANNEIEVILDKYKSENAINFDVYVNDNIYYAYNIIHNPITLDSIKFNNTTFYNVYTVTGNTPKKLYYTKKEGIVHIILPDYKTLTLVP